MSKRFIDHPEIRTQAQIRALVRDAEELVRLDYESDEIDEFVLFRAYNACGKALNRKKTSRTAPLSKKEADRLRSLQRRIIEMIVQRNVGLVYDMLRRTRVAGIDRDELVSEGLWTLFKAATSFDPWRGFKFSTYACTSILRAYVSLARKQRRNSEAMIVMRDQFEPLESTVESAADLDIQVAGDRLGRILARNSAQLTDLERFVIERRVLHDPGSKADTLSQVGEMVELSKERVRQVQLVALAKLEQALADDGFDADGFDDQNDESQEESILTPSRMSSRKTTSVA